MGLRDWDVSGVNVSWFPRRGQQLFEEVVFEKLNQRRQTPGLKGEEISA